jgi:hypothetical protein
MTYILQACAWEVNNILSNAGLRKIGSNPDYVPSVVAALQAGRGRQISEAETVPGDLTVAWCVLLKDLPSCAGFGRSPARLPVTSNLCDLSSLHVRLAASNSTLASSWRTVDVSPTPTVQVAAASAGSVAQVELRAGDALLAIIVAWHRAASRNYFLFHVLRIPSLQSSDGNFSGYFSCGGSTFWRVDN